MRSIGGYQCIISVYVTDKDFSSKKCPDSWLSFSLVKKFKDDFKKALTSGSSANFLKDLRQIFSLWIAILHFCRDVIVEFVIE